MKKILMFLCGVVLVFGIATAANATPMLGYSDFDLGYTLLSFDELSGGTVVDDEYNSLGLNISGTTGNDGTGLAMDIIAYNYWDPIYIGNETNNWDGSVIFTFDSSMFVTQFGLNIVDSYENWLSVYDSSNNLIETVYASGFITEDFVGIDTGSNAIAYAIASGDFYAVDDVAFNNGTAPVPEPATILLMGAGLIGLVGCRRKRSGKKS